MNLFLYMYLFTALACNHEKKHLIYLFILNWNSKIQRLWANHNIRRIYSAQCAVLPDWAGSHYGSHTHAAKRLVLMLTSRPYF